MNNISTDVFIAASSGGNLDLGSLSKHEITAKIKILMIQGVTLTKNVNFDEFNFYYVPSNFIRNYAVKNWSLSQDKIFVSYRGIAEENFSKGITAERDPYKLVYLGHPIKGLDTSIEITRQLRRSNPKYTLHVFGGYRLWGGPERKIATEPGVINYGLVGQKALAKHLQQMSFSLNLQEIQEAFGMAVTESMRAGCIVIASPVGAFTETIQNGYNGFLVSGKHTSDETVKKATQLILKLTDNPKYQEYVRRNAMHTPLSWKTVANTWEEHWNQIGDHSSNNHSERSFFPGNCSCCGGSLLSLADGFHCNRCGNYQPSISA